MSDDEPAHPYDPDPFTRHLFQLTEVANRVVNPSIAAIANAARMSPPGARPSDAHKDANGIRRTAPPPTFLASTAKHR
jgi:hypothetical protein